MTKLIIFLLGVFVGIVFIVTWTCLIVGSEADDRRLAEFKKWEKENETNDECQNN